MKKQNIIMGISFILLIFMVIGVSYAAYKFSATGTKENVISTGTISMSYSQNSFIDLKHTYPKTDTYAIATKEDKSSMEFSVSMETSGTKQINYVLALTEIQEGETLKSDKVKIYLEKEGKVVNNFETNKGQTIESFKNRYVEGLIDSYAIYQDILTTSNKTHHYILTSWIDESYILPIKNETTTSKQTNEETYKFKVKVVGVDTPITIKEKSTVSSLDTSGANAPVLASNMIPVYYDETSGVWKKADKNNKDNNNRWYSYESSGEYKGMWANAVTVKDTNRQTYLNANVGTPISMDDITTMWVWIPRFNAVTPSNYNGGTKANPGAIDVSFVKQNETAIDAFTFGDKELSGFWYGKFEIGGTLASSCTNETCNVSNIVVKPNVSSLRNQTVSSFFYASRSMEQTGNSFGFVSSEVDTHMSKNNEWGAVAYLTQSIYGRCTSNTTCTEVGINNNTSYITGIGDKPSSTASSVKTNTYNTISGKNASTTGNIYGIYDMSGGAWEYVMGIYNKNIKSSGFSTLPDNKYYNNYTATSYTGHAISETKGWYNDQSFSVYFSVSPWFIRGCYYDDGELSGMFAFYGSSGINGNNSASRFVITNE